jgi:hypothetical protein
MLAMVRPASTSTGEDQLTAAVLPSVVPAGVAGITITVAGTNFHPGGDGDPADALSIACVFAGIDGPNAIVPARLVTGGGASCEVPYNPSPSGFISVGLSANKGVDARFFRGAAGGEVLAFSAPGDLRSTVGPRTWARGDAVHLTGADMAPRDAGGYAVVGASFPCGWRTSSGVSGESPGVFASTAVRVCEVSPSFAGPDAHLPMRLGATLDVAHRRHGVRGGGVRVEPSERSEADERRGGVSSGAAALAIALAEPPELTGVSPSTVATEGGATLEIATRGSFGAEATREGAWARIGTTRVTAEPGWNPDGNVAVATWRCVTPARRSTFPSPSSSLETTAIASDSDAPTVAIAASPFGAERVDAASRRRLRFVSAIAVAARTVPAFASATESLATARYAVPKRSIGVPPSGVLSALAGHHAASIRDALGRDSADFSPAATTAFAFGVARGGPTTRFAYPAAGPSGGGGIVWITGASLLSTRGVCDFWFEMFGDVPQHLSPVIANTASIGISSAVVACEAPAFSAAAAAAATGALLVGPNGAARYLYLPDVSPGLDVPGGYGSVVAAPANGPSRGGTTVSLSRSRRGAWGWFLSGGGFETLAGTIGAGGCRFGPVAVAARDVRSDAEDVSSGVVGAISCVAPAGRPGRVAVAVVDSASGAACDAGGYALADGEWRRHRLDDRDG